MENKNRLVLLFGSIYQHVIFFTKDYLVLPDFVLKKYEKWRRLIMGHIEPCPR